MRTLLTITAAALIAATGCDNSSSSADAGAAAPAPAANAWLVASAPENALPVSEAKSTAAEGDTVTVRARIGGRRDPMTDGSPVFTVVDMELKHCAQIHGDRCATPWDYCCEPRDSLTNNSATVQLIAEGADPVAAGLEPLDEIIVTGTVGPRPSPEVFTIRAETIHRVGG